MLFGGASKYIEAKSVKTASNGKNAFRDCVSLTNLSIPDNVVTIEEDAFRNCSVFSPVPLCNMDGIGKDVISPNEYSYELGNVRVRTIY